MPHKNNEKRIAWEKKYRARKAYLHKIWARKNKDRRNAERREYLKKNPKVRLKLIKYLRRRKSKSPWLGHYDCARTRCLNTNSRCFHRYGARGIKFLLTHEEIKCLWFRDMASKLKNPSLDRINNDGNYEFHNCRFIEKSLNSTKGNYEARWKR